MGLHFEIRALDWPVSEYRVPAILGYFGNWPSVMWWELLCVCVCMEIGDGGHVNGRAHVSQFAIITLRLRIQRKRKLRPIFFSFSPHRCWVSMRSPRQHRFFTVCQLSISIFVVPTPPTSVHTQCHRVYAWRVGKTWKWLSERKNTFVCWCSLDEHTVTGLLTRSAGIFPLQPFNGDAGGGGGGSLKTLCGVILKRNACRMFELWN